MEQGKKAAIHVLIGVAAGILTLIVLSAAAAWAISAEHLTEESIPFFGMMTLTISLFVGARVTVKQERQRTLICSALTGALILLLVMIFKMLWFPGWRTGLWWSVIPGIAAIIGAAMLPTRDSAKKRRR